MQFLYLSGFVDARADIVPEIKRPIRPARARYIQSAQAGCARHVGCPVYSKGAHAKRRGDGNPPVRVCGMDSLARSTSLSCERHTTNSSCGLLASSADDAATISCRTPRPPKQAQQCGGVETTIGKRRLFFAAAVQPPTNQRLTRLLIVGAMTGGENPGPGRQ